MRRTLIHLIRVVSFAVVVVFVLSLMPHPAYAATLTVTNLFDAGAGSLRYEITNAASGDMIGFSVAGTITLESQLPAIAKTLTIDGSTSPGSITIARDTLAANFGLMQVTSSGNLTLNDLTLSHGSTPTSGGAIDNLGTLMVNNVTFSDNTASVAGGVAGGGIYLNKASASATITNSAFTNNTALEGGAIYVNFGTLKMTDTTFTDNTATSSGAGGILAGRGTTTITGCTFTDNQALASVGGAVTTSGTLLTVTDSSFNGNTAAQGGGIYSYTPVTITNSTFTNNQATSSDGGGINSGDTLSVTDSTFSGNQAAGSGGAIDSSATTTVTSSTFSGNSATADQGGGINNQGTLTVTNSTFSNNTAIEGGGGGLRNEGTATVINSTFSGNSVRFSGGGIQNFDTLTVINSTFSGNSAGYGGGIVADAKTTTTVTNSTFSGNSATSFGSGVSGVTALNNSILDDNTSSSSDCDTVSASSISHTLIQDGSCGVGTVPPYSNGNLSGDPKLGTLTGSPAFFPLQSDSPVIDAGDNNLAVDQNNQPLTTDQRGVGYARIFNGTVDMGAYEFGSTPPAASTTSGASQPSMPLSALCADVTSLANGAITVSGGVQNVLLNGVYGNTYCHLIASGGTYLTSPAEIGVQSVISLGVVDAVDVFGQLPGGASVVPFVAPVTVCLRGVASLTDDVLFLSAADSTRTPQRLAATVSGGFECVSVSNSGTVVLVGSASNLPAAPTAAPSDPVPATLADCKVTTTHSPLNLRSEANTSASVIAQLPYQLTLTATAHQSGWYQVIYGSEQGWVSDQFVSMAGDCGG